jgi:hypothetical protein
LERPTEYCEYHPRNLKFGKPTECFEYHYLWESEVWKGLRNILNIVISGNLKFGKAYGIFCISLPPGIFQGIVFISSYFSGLTFPMPLKES